MKKTWRVTTNVVDGRTVYGVYRIIDPDEPEHSGNREVLDYYDTREGAENCADAFNRGGVGVGDLTGFMESELPIDKIKTNILNPRKNFDEEKLQELAESILQMGVLQPLIVAKDLDDRGAYYLIAGERRLRAAAMAGLDRVPVIYRSGLFVEPETQVVAMLIENLQREDLDPIEEANAFAALTKEHGWKQTDLAAKIGVSQSHIANRIRLLNLPEAAQEAISTGKLTATAGKELATLAKVPAVREIIEEAIADEDSAQNIVWQAKNTAYNATKPLHKQGYPEPLFQLKDCEGCKYRIMLPERHSGDGKTLPFCMDVSCWEAKQKEAEEEAAEKARQQALDLGQEIIDLGELPSGSYEHLSNGYGVQFDQTECEGCEHSRLGQSQYRDKPISICLNPACYKAKQTAAKAEQRQRATELREAHDEHKEELIAAFYPQGLLDSDDPDSSDFKALVYIAAQAVDDPPYSSSMSKAKVKAAVYERYGWEPPKGLGWSDEIRHLVSQLEALSVDELLRLIFYAMVKPVEHDSVVFEAVYGGGVDDE